MIHLFVEKRDQICGNVKVDKMIYPGEVIISDI